MWGQKVQETMAGSSVSGSNLIEESQAVNQESWMSKSNCNINAFQGSSMKIHASAYRQAQPIPILPLSKWDGTTKINGSNTQS